MIGREILLKIADTYTKFFGFLPKTPVYWCPLTRRMVAASDPQLLGIKIACVFPMLLFSFFPKIYHALHIRYTMYVLGTYPHDDFYASRVQLVGMIPNTLGTGMGLGAYIFAISFRLTLTSLLNCLLSLEEELALKKLQAAASRTSSRQRILNKLAYICPLVTLYTVPAIAVFGIYYKMDPFHYFVKRIVGFDSESYSVWLKYLENTISFFLLSWGTLVWFQLLTGGIIILLVGTCFFIRALRLLEWEFSVTGRRTSTWRKLNLYIVRYHVLFLVVQIFSPAIATMGLSSLCVSGCTCVALGYLVVKAYNRMPPISYSTLPVSLVTILFVTNEILMLVAALEEGCRNTLHRWRTQRFLYKEKAWAKRVAAMRPIRVNLGVWRTNMLVINKQLCTDFNNTFAVKTASLLIA